MMKTFVLLFVLGAALVVAASATETVNCHFDRLKFCGDDGVEPPYTPERLFTAPCMRENVERFSDGCRDAYDQWVEEQKGGKFPIEQEDDEPAPVEDDDEPDDNMWSLIFFVTFDDDDQDVMSTWGAVALVLAAIVGSLLCFCGLVAAFMHCVVGSAASRSNLPLEDLDDSAWAYSRDAFEDEETLVGGPGADSASAPSFVYMTPQVSANGETTFVAVPVY